MVWLAGQWRLGEVEGAVRRACPGAVRVLLCPAKSSAGPCQVDFLGWMTTLGIWVLFARF